MHVTDGMTDCSATLDDSVSEEEEYSFDELTDVTPYLQPGVELSVLNEVRLRREACHVATLTNIPSKNACWIYDVAWFLLLACLVNNQVKMFLVCVCFQHVWPQFSRTDNHCSVHKSRHNLTCQTWA